MTDNTQDQPIAFVVRVERVRSDYALIPVIAITAEEAKAIAKTKWGETHHTWHTFQSELKITNQIEARNMANDHQTAEYKRTAP